MNSRPSFLCRPKPARSAATGCCKRWAAAHMASSTVRCRPAASKSAIKEIRFLATQAESKRKLQMLNLISKLHHPYLLSLHDFWTENNQLFVAMELAETSLAELAKKLCARAYPPNC